MSPLTENIWPQIRLLPSALLLNSSAKIRLGLKAYKISQERHLLLQWLYWWPVLFILELLLFPVLPAELSRDRGTCISLSSERRCKNILGSQSARARAEQWGGLEAQGRGGDVFSQGTTALLRLALHFPKICMAKPSHHLHPADGRC